MEMADFIADREDLTDTIVELVDQKGVEVTNSKKDEEEVIKEGFFSFKNVRHNTICDAIFDTAAAAALAPLREVRDLLPGNN